MTLSILKTGVINVYYTFADETYEKPFEVPLSMVDPKRNEISEDAKLSDYLQINNWEEGPLSIAFIYNGAMFHRIDNILLLPHVNNLDATSFTRDGMANSKIMGLWERTAPDLYLD